MLSGAVFADKPPGLSSSGLVAKLKKKLGVKTGHTGTLDRFAEGLMILLAGPATSFSDYFLHLDKAYRAVIQFGTFTDTHDPNGEVMQSRSPEETEMFLKEAKGGLSQIVKEFENIRTQTPPVYSALKRDGIRYSDRARKGEEILPGERPVRVYSAELISVDIKNHTCVCEFHVSSGAYIRSLVRDLSVRMAFPAHLKELRRIRVGPFSVDAGQVWNLENEPVVIPVTDLIFWPRLSVPLENVPRIASGQILSLPGVPDDDFFIVDPEGKLLARAFGKNGGYIYKRVFH